MLVTEFKRAQGLRFPDEFLDCLPDVCLDERCGSPTEMSETLTGLHCSNPRCPTKIAKRITAIATSLGVKDLGKSRANDFISKFGIDNPLIVFAYEPSSDGEMGYSISMDMSKKIADQFANKKSFTLWEYVRIANLPFIQSSALHIFGEYDDLAEAYRDIESGGVDFIRSKLGVSKGKAEDSDDGITDVSVRAIKVYESLMMFKNDLFTILPYVNIIKTHTEGMKTLKAVCSEQVGDPYRTKAEFYASVNSMFPDIHVEFLSSVNKGIDYLIWAGADGSSSHQTSKVRKVTGWNEAYRDKKASGSLREGDHEIPIVTANEFINILRGMSK